MGIDLEKLKKYKEKLEEEKAKRKEEAGLFMKLQEGDNVVRILPLGDTFFKEVYQHRVGKKIVTCPKTFGKDCPICEMAKELEAKGVKHNLSPRVRYYSVVVHKDDGIKVLGYGVSILNGLMDLLFDAEWGDFTSRENGYAVNIKRTGTGLDTEYNVMPRPKKPVPEKIYQAWLAQIPDLDKLFAPLSYEDLTALLEGVEVEGE